jgi:hypothetical protein
MKIGKYASLLFLCLSAFGQSNLDYSHFSIIVERNIFDPDRGTTNTVHSRTNYDTFTLVGLMQYEKGTFAFFDSTNVIYQKTLKVNDRIANYTVSALTPNMVTLVSSNETLRVKVGMNLTNKLSKKVTLDKL